MEVCYEQQFSVVSTASGQPQNYNTGETQRSNNKKADIRPFYIVATYFYNILWWHLIVSQSLSFSQSNSLSPFLFFTVNKSDKKHKNVINKLAILGQESHVRVQ